MKIAAAGSAAVCIGGLNPMNAADEKKKKKKPLIALQLYSVRKDCGKDFDKTVKAVAEMGYAGVEFAGYGKYGKDPKGLKKLLDDCGLKVAGSHTKINLKGDGLEKLIDFHKTIGNKYLIIPGMRHKGIEGWKKAAKDLSEIAEKLKEHDMYTGYHAHGHDFKKIDGTTTWEAFFDAGSKDLVMQMDTGNCLGGGGDPYALIKKYPGQSKTVHLKDHFKGKKGVLGEGTVKWKEVLTMCETIGGTEWYIIEQESYPTTPLETVKKCLEGLKKIQASM